MKALFILLGTLSTERCNGNFHALVMARTEAYCDLKSISPGELTLNEMSSIIDATHHEFDVITTEARQLIAHHQQETIQQ